MLVSSLPGEGGWPFLAPKPLWWPTVLCPPSWDSDTGLGCGPLIHLASLLSWFSWRLVTFTLWEPKLHSRCIRNSVAGVPRYHPLDSGGDGAVCSLQGAEQMRSFLCVPGCEKGGKHCFKAHGSEALWGAGHLRFCCGIGGLKRWAVMVLNHTKGATLHGADTCVGSSWYYWEASDTE